MPRASAQVPRSSCHKIAADRHGTPTQVSSTGTQRGKSSDGLQKGTSGVRWPCPKLLNVLHLSFSEEIGTVSN